MRFMGTALIGAYPFSQLLGPEQTGWLDNGALTMNPLGHNQVEPGALDRQIADEDAHTPPRCVRTLAHSRLCIAVWNRR